MRVTAVRHCRAMRGGSQAQMLLCDDGAHYITKFRETPQGLRTLANEWIGSWLLRRLAILCAAPAIVDLSSELSQSGSLKIQFGCSICSVTTRTHYGSRYPGDADKDAVYDYFPSSKMHLVTNLHDFIGVLCFDKWVDNVDKRQSVFARVRLPPDSPGSDQSRKQFRAFMIDHGMIFGGTRWKFGDAPLAGTYFTPSVYAGLETTADLDPWIESILSLPDSLVDFILSTTPPEWLDSDRSSLERLLEVLWRRRTRVGDLVLSCIRSSPQYFPQFRFQQPVGLTENCAQATLDLSALAARLATPGIAPPASSSHAAEEACASPVARIEDNLRSPSMEVAPT